MDKLNGLYTHIFGFIELNELFAEFVFSIFIMAVFKLLSVIVKKNSLFITSKIFKAKTENGQTALYDCIVKPICQWLIVTGVFLAVRILPFSAEFWIVLWPVLIKAYRIALILIFCAALVSLIGDILILSPRVAENADKTAYSFFSKLAKGIIIAFAVAAFLTELNFDVSGIIAGLGIGGVVLALAAQDTASNFFSGVVILFDKPFEIGDWISVAGMEGVVEEMNFRSCRIRTFDNALISVPNSKLSSDNVTNWAKMEMRKAKITFGLTYSTNKETLQSICEEIKANLLTYEDIKTDSILVYFDKFNASSLDIVVQYNSYLTAFKAHAALKEKVQYMIMETVEKHNSDFAFDTKTIIMESAE